MWTRVGNTGTDDSTGLRQLWGCSSLHLAHPHSDENPEVAVLPKDKLVSLCKCDPILKWMRSCDHILYQALVEVLIPDVLRPVPSKHSPPASPLPVPVPLQPPHRGPLRLGAPRVQ